MTWTRVLTAAVLMTVAIAIVLFAPTWGVAIAVVVLTLLALWEYFALGEAIGHRAYRFWTTFSAIVLVCAQTLPAATRDYFNKPLGWWPNFVLTVRLHLSVPLAFFVFVLGIVILTLWTRRPLVESVPAAGISSSAFLLVAFPLSYALPLHGYRGPRVLLFALVITWVADSAAYFAGRAFGKHPLAPHISPKKTWEGSIAGLVGSLAVGYAFHFWLTIPFGHLLAMAFVGNVAGQMGDLLESACKRSAGVKDSGGLLPGHGGILDRIDALILCIPVIWYYLVLVNPGM